MDRFFRVCQPFNCLGRLHLASCVRDLVEIRLTSVGTFLEFLFMLLGFALKSLHFAILLIEDLDRGVLCAVHGLLQRVRTFLGASKVQSVLCATNGFDIRNNYVFFALFLTHSVPVAVYALVGFPACRQVASSSHSSSS